MSHRAVPATTRPSLRPRSIDDAARRRPRRLPLSDGPAAPAEPGRRRPRPRGGLVPRRRTRARRVPRPRVARGRPRRAPGRRRHAPRRALGGADRRPPPRRARRHVRRPRRGLVPRARALDHAGRPQRAVRRDRDRPGARSQGGGAGEPAGGPRLAGARPGAGPRRGRARSCSWRSGRPARPEGAGHALAAGARWPSPRGGRARRRRWCRRDARGVGRAGARGGRRLWRGPGPPTFAAGSGGSPATRSARSSRGPRPSSSRSP